MNPHIYLYSHSHLEPWDRTTPQTTKPAQPCKTGL